MEILATHISDTNSASIEPVSAGEADALRELVAAELSMVGGGAVAVSFL